MCPCRLAGRLPGSAVTARLTSDGVSYHNISPRWAVAWDLFGTGKTSVKWNMGKYLAGAGIAGIYADANPAQRTVNTYIRTWTDVNGNRRVDCDLLNFNAQNIARRGHLRRANLGRRAGQRAVWARPAQPGRRRYADRSGHDAVRTTRSRHPG